MHRAIEWFVDNPVAANLMMFIFLVGGLMSMLSMHKEEFPNIEPGLVQISIPYLGAAPEEVEQAVCIRVEEAIEGVNGMDKVRSIASEGMCTVIIELNQDSNYNAVLNEIKSKIDCISTFPRETEKPNIAMMQFRGQTIVVALSGNTDEATLKRIAENMRNDIADLPNISQVVVNYARPYEISIEISENNLRQYGLTLGSVASAIQRSSLDMPGG